MVDQTQNWSKSWKSSTDPQKQRKYRQNAPQHVKDNFISANLSNELRNQLDTRNLQLNLGDRVQVTRGDFKGSSGIISNIDRQNQKVYINGLEVERQDGSTSQVPFQPSNLQIQALNLEHVERVQKYDVEDTDEIQVDEEEVEEVLSQDDENEMMEQMQGGQGPDMQDIDTDDLDVEDVDEELETEDDEDTEDDVEESADAEGIVSGTIGDAKDQISELENPDFDKLIQSEKDNKNRKTMIEYLEDQKKEDE